MPDTGLPVWLVDCPALFGEAADPTSTSMGEIGPIIRFALRP
jgi:hypothetical protein